MNACPGIAERAAQFDAGIRLARRCARSGVDEVAGPAEARPDGEGTIAERYLACVFNAVVVVVFEVVAADGILRDAQSVALALLENGLVVGKDAVDAAGGRVMSAGDGKPAQRTFGDAVVVRREPAASSHDVEGIAVF